MSLDTVTRAVECLGNGDRAVLLTRLMFYLAQTARDAYVEAGTRTDDSAQRLKGCNEIQIVLISELMSVDNAAASRSPGDLVESLQHWARIGNCARELDWACHKAMEPRA